MTNKSKKMRSPLLELENSLIKNCIDLRKKTGGSAIV